MALINIGVHKLESYKNSQGLFENSYFIHRAYLNYLIFSPRSTEMFYDYFMSKGGIGKQIYTDHVQTHFGTGKIFDKFGATALITNPATVNKTESFKIEYYGKDFSDVDITYPWDAPHELHWYIINQKGKKFLVTDEHLILSENTWYPNPKCSYSPEKIDHINDLVYMEFDYLLPRLHTGDFILQNISSNKPKEFISNFNKALESC